jgi:spermidine synthase
LISAALGKTNDAIQHLSEALRQQPDQPEAHYTLGELLLNQGHADEAARHFRAALKTRPNSAEAHYQLAVILAGRQQPAEAIAHYRDAVRLKPNWVEALNNLAWSLATQADPNLRNGAEAVRLAAHAVALTRTNNPGALDTLAAAYAEAGRFSAAAETAQAAVKIATAAGQKDLAAEIRQRGAAYEAGRAYRE